jgi:hypothetical protein
MVKVVSISVVVILAVASGVSGQTLTQGQTWNIGLGSNVNLIGAGGSASNMQGLTALNMQSLGSGLGVTGTQDFNTALLQIGSVCDDPQAPELIAQATPLILSVDGLNMDLSNLGGMSSFTPFTGTSAPFGVSTASIPWDIEGTGGLGKPF